MEFVYVVPRPALFPEFYPHGLHPFGKASGPSLADFEAVLEKDGFFVERAYAERTPALKQIIPYSLVECGGKVLLVRRTKKGGESRLFDKLSIGIGGHVNPEDLGDAPDAQRDVVAAGTRRELEEELAIDGTYEVRRVGLLNDDANSVGAVHVGVVQVVTVRGTVEIREREQLEGRLVTPDELRALHADGANFETWSEVLVRRLDELIQQPMAVAS